MEISVTSRGLKGFFFLQNNIVLILIILNEIICDFLKW